MTIEHPFRKHFSPENLKDIFTDWIIYSRATGIDGLSPRTFKPQLDTQIEIISRKALAGKYKFTKYKLKLVSKGRNKPPREISIPTVRDRIALRSLCNFLTEAYEGSIEFHLPQDIVKNIKLDFNSQNYDGCIKLDVINFYPSIKHEELISRLGKKIRDTEIKDIILSAISSPTVSASGSSEDQDKKGVPQGIAVSNILAAIYLSNIDKELTAADNIKYYRYVDDVLIFCSLADTEKISEQVIYKFNEIGLDIYHPAHSSEKSSIGPLDDGFEYLGYKFSEENITARSGSIERLKGSLVSIFTSYKHSKKKSEVFLLWRLNLRITGCIYKNKSKGWLFFFSEINDETLLHSLDHYVKKLVKRFGVSVKPKKFVRAFKELSHRKYETKYIPNFDRYSLEEMKTVLVNYFGLELKDLPDEDIKFEFKKRLNKQVKDLQVDVMNFS